MNLLAVSDKVHGHHGQCAVQREWRENQHEYRTRPAQSVRESHNSESCNLHRLDPISIFSLFSSQHTLIVGPESFGPTIQKYHSATAPLLNRVKFIRLNR